MNYPLVALREACGVALMFNMHQTRRKGFLRSSLCGPDKVPVDLVRLPLDSIRSFQYTVLHHCHHLRPGETYVLSLEIVGDVSEGISVCGQLGAPTEGQTKLVWIGPEPRRWFVPDSPERIQSLTSPRCVIVHSQQTAEGTLYSNIFGRAAEFVSAERLLEEWGKLLRADIVVFDCVAEDVHRDFDQIVFTLHRHGVITFGAERFPGKSKPFEICHYGIGSEARSEDLQNAIKDNVRGLNIGPISKLDIARCVAEARGRRYPDISVVISENLHHAWSIAEKRLHDLAISARVVAPLSSSLVGTAIESSAASEISILLLLPDVADLAHLIRMFVFEHWYPEVGACFGANVAGSHSQNTFNERDMRCLSIRGQAAHDCLLASLRSSEDNLASIGPSFSQNLSHAGIVQRVLAPSSSATSLGEDCSEAALPKKAMHWIREKASSRLRLPRLVSSRRSRLRILAYRWHVPHQVELMRLPAEFTLASGFPQNITEQWSFDQRPLPSNARFLHFSEIDPRDYDLAIVHFDENVLCPELSNGVLPKRWGEPFNWLISLDNVPKIGICHGTPPFKGQYGVLPPHIDQFEVDEEQRLKLVKLLGTSGVMVVCNSFQAEQEWRYAKSKTIWHGFDPSEFRPQPSLHDVLASPLDRARPHYRGLAKQQQILRELDPAIGVRHKLKRTPLEIDNTSAFSHRQFWYYSQQISSFRVYLNTTLRSPMPRSRGEAMMGGVVPISLANNDVQMFVRNGVDGFYSDNPSEIAAFINDSFRDLRALEAMRAAARQKALEVFHIDRFRDDWLRLIKDVIGWAPSADAAH